jgi:GAF domain-containing protein
MAPDHPRCAEGGSDGLDAAGGRSRGERATRRLAAIRRVPDETAYLYQIIQTIGSGPDLEAILRGIVRLVTEATDCHACLIFFVQEGRLVLRCASAPYAHLADKVGMAIGEGLVGWVAKTRRSAFIRENALQDPRVLYFPEFEEERFQSLVSVPIFARDGEVIGVVSLHAEAPHEFGRADLDLLEHTASLVGGAVENARLYEEATARVALLTDLSRLAQRIASANGVDDLLPMVAQDGRELLGAERCEIHLLDGDDRLVLRAANPPRAPDPPVDMRRLWIDALGPVSGGRSATAARRDDEAGALAEALWGERHAGTPVLAPMSVGEERLGVLAALIRAPSPDAHTVVSAVASHLAVALKQHELIDWLREKNLVKEFFEALGRGAAGGDELRSAAARLAYDLSAPHLVMHARAWSPAQAPSRRGRRPASEDPAPPPWRELAERLELRLASFLPGALFDRRETSMRALIRASDGHEEAVEAVRRAYGRVAEAEADGIAVGLSNVCRGVASFPRGFDEAYSAAEVGALIRGGPGVSTYEELGPYKYVLGADVGVRDRHQEALDRLATYDRRRGTQLLQTLEGYLDGRGNVVGSSRTLYIHPNTLRQRLARIERVADLNLEREDWLSLAIAVKVVKLRQMRRLASDGDGANGA